MKNAVIFYMTGAAVMAALFLGMKNHRATFRGRPVSHPRLVLSVLAGLLWPVVIYQMIFTHRPGAPDIAPTQEK
jgi:hypothetical protein